MKLVELTDGNPGTMHFLTSLTWELLNKVMDTNIKGADLYVLWSDLSNKDSVVVEKLIDNCPLDVLQDACSRQDYSGRKLVAEYLI